MTKYGKTRNIKIRDSIRQGGVPSTTEYGLLMDEISKEIKKADLGIQIEGMPEKIGSLLWVDDVCIPSTKNNEMQQALDITEDKSSQYHIEYGAPKSNIQQIKNNKKKEEMPTFKLGDMTLEQADKYKYLRQIQNEKNNNDDHFSALKGKLEGAYQKLLTLAGDAEFYNIEMEVMWKLLETCIMPIITYGGEAWEIKKQDYKKINSMFENIIRRILKVPQGTPREALYLETGLLSPEIVIKKPDLAWKHESRKEIM